MKNYLRYFSLGIAIVISGLFIYLAFRGSDFGEIVSILGSLRYSWYIWSLAALALHLYLKSLRWQFILSSLKQITIVSAFSNVTIGLMANNILPARLGEFVRIYSMAKTEKLRQSTVLSTLIIERLFDGYCLILFLVIGFSFGNFSLSPTVLLLIRRACILALVIYTGILIFLIFLKQYSTPLVQRFKQKKVDNKVAKFLLEKLVMFIEGLRILKGLKSTVIVGVLSVLIWLSFVSSTYLMMFMFEDNGVPMGNIVGFIGNIYFIGIVSVGLLIPAAPGYIGTYEWFSKSALVPFGISESIIDSFIIFSHGSGYILFTFIGLLMFFRSHLSLKMIREQFRRKGLLNEKYN